MKLKMIGTGAICSKERSASTLIDDHILIDCGNGIVKTLLEQDVDIEKIDKLLITHLHGDHFLDTIFLIIQRGYLNCQNGLTIYGPKGITSATRALFKIAYNTSDFDKKLFKAKVSFCEFDATDTFKFKDGLSVKPVSVKHGSFELSFGFIIENKDTKVFFSGDSSYTDELCKIVSSVNTAILDTTFMDGNEKHMGAYDIEKISSMCDTKIILTHVGTMARLYFNEHKSEKIILPNDGDIINI